MIVNSPHAYYTCEPLALFTSNTPHALIIPPNTHTRTLNQCVWFRQHGEPPVEWVYLSDVDQSLLHEAAEDVEGLGPHVLNLLPPHPRLTVRGTVLSLDLSGEGGGRKGEKGRENYTNDAWYSWFSHAPSPSHSLASRLTREVRPVCGKTVCMGMMNATDKRKGSLKLHVVLSDKRTSAT